MDISITGRHIELKDSLKKYATEKFSHIDRFFSGITSVEIVLKHEDRKVHCEAIIHAKKHATLVVDVARDEFNEAIDLAVDKCERQLRRLKEKVEDKRSRQSAGAMAGAAAEDEGEDAED